MVGLSQPIVNKNSLLLSPGENGLPANKRGKGKFSCQDDRRDEEQSDSTRRPSAGPADDKLQTRIETQIYQDSYEHQGVLYFQLLELFSILIQKHKHQLTCTLSPSPCEAAALRTRLPL